MGVRDAHVPRTSIDVALPATVDFSLHPVGRIIVRQNGAGSFSTGSTIMTTMEKLRRTMMLKSMCTAKDGLNWSAEPLSRTLSQTN